ncbi:unnamed protein product [Blepharisma stoltei]|uniref:Protein kinase domain-containing protein n=1 Tax=Blepharisma stoltei TaxID=1481888 RepID=A0AAU9INV5_9CILI|nr:unnamed protein product [Blepharisma stoltei]
MKLMHFFEPECKNEVEYSCPCTSPETLSCELHAGKHMKIPSRAHSFNSIFVEPRKETKEEIIKFLTRENSKNSKLRGDNLPLKEIIKFAQKPSFYISDLVYKEQIHLLKDEIREISTSIWIAENNSQTVAVKKYTYRKKKLTRKYKKEAKFLAILDLLNHPFFVKFYKFGKKSLEGQFEFCVVMEYCPSSLHRQIMEKIVFGENSNSIIAKIVDKLLSGFVKLSSLNIVHRDIKPQNILVSEDGEYKLIDFGISEVVSSISEENEYLIKGTHDYMSPELISELNKNSQTCVKFKYNLEKADVYSLGLVFWKISTGKRVKGINQIIYQEEMCEILNEIKLNWLRKVLEKMLLMDPAKRFTFKEAYTYLKEDDDFIKDLNLA